MENECRPSYRLLSDDQIQRIHTATLNILENVGVKIPNEEGLELLRDEGCKVENENIIKIPASLVEKSIKSVPTGIEIFSRDGDFAMLLEERNSYYGLGTDLVYTYDLETGETRESVLQDVINAAIVADYCENVDFLASFALPHDVPTNTMYIECFKAQVENSSKPIFFTAAGKEDLSYIIKMAETVVGSENKLQNEPFLIHYSEPLAPLTHSYGAINKLLLCAEKRVPICYIPTVLLGASGPVTLAGGITQANAEALSGIVLHQLKQRGSPIISGWATVPLDMKATTYCYGSPELRLTNTAFADIYHHYEIPMWSIVGTDAHVLDQQASMEHAFGTLMAALDGANLIHDVGYLGQGLLGNPASIVMCDEMISYIKRIMRGFDLTDETLALDVIKKVGPGGNFLAEKHTLKHFRKELWMPKYANRENPDTWKAKGSITYEDKLIKKARQILNEHKPMRVSEEISQKLNEILIDAENKLADFQFSA